MRIAAVNGSPRGGRGMTAWVLEAFLEGAREAKADIETIELAGKRIHYCTGELACWFATPGTCIHSDDMGPIVESIGAADCLVLATPVYFDGMTGLMKNFLDRLVPMADPHFELRHDHMRHPARKSAPNKLALVSVCGFHERDNFDPLLAHAKAIGGNMGAQFCGAVIRPAAPMIPYLKLRHPLRLRSVTRAIKRAGFELAHAGRISREAEEESAAEMMPRQAFINQCNWYFDRQLGKIKGK